MSGIQRVIIAGAGLAALSASTLNHARAEEEYYSYHPRSILTLGGGFTPSNMSEAKLKCVDFTAVPAPGESAALSTTMNTYFVSSSSKLKSIMGIDVKIEASYLTSKANAGLQLDTERMFKSDSVTLMVLAQSEYGRMLMDQPKLTPYAESLWKTRPEDFEKECGTHLVRMIRRGAMIAVFVTLTNLTEEQKNKITVEAGFEARGEVASATLKSKFQDQMERSHASNSVRTQVISTGGEGISSLADMVRLMTLQPDSLDKIEAAVGQFMKTFTAANPAPIGFYAAPFGFGITPGKFVWEHRRQKRLGILADHYGELDAKLDDIRHLLMPEDPRHAGLTTTQVAGFTRVADQLEEALNVVADSHKACMVERSLKACQMPQYELDAHVVPPMPARPTLLALPSSPRIDERDLEVQGQAVSRVRVYLNDTKIVDQQIADLGPTVNGTHRIDLDFFWESRKSRIRGIVTGQVVIDDRFGRSTTYRFFRAAHSEFGSSGPLHETFSRAGRL